MKRVLLKLSGEALAGDKHTGFDEPTVTEVAKQVKQIVDGGTEVGCGICCYILCNRVCACRKICTYNYAVYSCVGMAVVFCSCMDGISYKKIW